MATLPGLDKSVFKDPSPPIVDSVLSPITIPNGTTLVTTKTTNETIDNVNELIDYISGDNGPNFIPQLAIDSLVSDLSARELLANKGAVSGYAGLDASQELLLVNFPSGTALQVLRRNAGNTALEFVDVASGESQTPILQDVNYDGFDIKDLSNIEFGTTTGVPGPTIPAIYFTNGRLHFNIPSSLYRFHVNGVKTFEIDADGIHLEGGKIFEVDLIAFTTTLNTIERVGTELQYDVESGSIHVVRVDDVTEYSYSATQADFNNNNLINVTIVTPTIASFVNAGHSHEDAVGGGLLDSTLALSDTADIAYLNTANTYIAGNKQSFVADATTAAINLNAQLPSVLVAGDIYRTAEVLHFIGTTATDYILVSDGQPTTYTAGVRQDFLGLLAGTSGLNVGGIAGNPTTQVDGDIWLNTSSNTLFGRINGADVDLGAGAGGGEANTISSLGGGTVLTAVVPKSGVNLQTVSIATTGPIAHAVVTDLLTFSLDPLVNADISATAEIAVSKLADGTPGQFIRTDSAGTGVEWTDDIFTINFIIDGGGSAITTGIKGQVVVDFNCEVIEWAIIGLPAGAIVVDVSRSTFAGFPTTASIAGTELPAIVATNDTGEDRTITTWSIINTGDILEFEVDSVSTIERCTVALKCRKTG